MKTWIKGGLIGIGIGIIFVLLINFMPLIMMGGLGYILLLLDFTGFDLFVYSIVSKSSSLRPFFLSLFLFIELSLLGGIIGHFLDKEELLKKKLIVLAVLIILIAPLSAYSHHLKSNDKEIANQYLENLYKQDRNRNNNWSKDIGLLNEEICNKISIFNQVMKEDCIYEVIVNQIDSNLCTKLLDPARQNSCRFYINERTGDLDKEQS